MALPFHSTSLLCVHPMAIAVETVPEVPCPGSACSVSDTGPAQTSGASEMGSGVSRGLDQRAWDFALGGFLLLGFGFGGFLTDNLP